MTMQILELSSSHISDCSALYADVFSSPPWNEPWSINEAEKRLRFLIESPGFLGFVSMNDKQLTGLLCATIEPFAGGNASYLRELCITPASRNHGVAGQLVETLHKALSSRGVMRSYLITQAGTLAERLYLRKGYQIEKNDLVMIAHISR